MADIFEATTSVANSTLSNVTEESTFRETNPALSILYNVLVILQVSLLMLSMGSGTEMKEIKRYLHNPKGPIIGVICQLILMPALTFAFAHALNVDGDLAIGMVVVASCPGGAPANVFTLVSRGNLSLSVCLTVFSSIFALVTMPLNKIIYIRSWTSHNAIIPYTNIVTAIVSTWLPALIGIGVKYKWPAVGAKLTKIGGLVAFFVLLAFSFVQQFVYPGVFSLDWSVWFAAIFLPILGWVMGFGVATLSQFEIAERRAIAYGTSFVNGGLALALIVLSFGDSKEINRYIMFPMLYTAGQLVLSIVITLLHIFYFRLKENNTICHRKCCKTDTCSTADDVSDVTLEEEKKSPNAVHSNGQINEGFYGKGDMMPAGLKYETEKDVASLVNSKTCDHLDEERSVSELNNIGTHQIINEESERSKI